MELVDTEGLHGATHYPLEEWLYNRKCTIQDILPSKDRYLRYDHYSHSGLFNEDKGLPAFAEYLRSQGHEEVWKAFSIYNLKDSSEELRLSMGPAIVEQVFRTIDLYLTNVSRQTIPTVFRMAKKERLEEQSFLQNKKIVFSTNPWDIATMSMRGISSCMSWHNTRASSLAGSILDPYCGLIYLEGPLLHRGLTCVYGKAMIARCVVRLIKSANGKYLLLLERVYTDATAANNKKQHLIYDMFKSYLTKKSGLEVIGTSQIKEGMVIPFFCHLPFMAANSLSYRDSAIPYETVL